jgi:hypothetical protein
MDPTVLSWVLPRNKTCCFLVHHHSIQCLVPNIPPAGSPIPWQYVLGTQPAIIAKFLTLQRKMVPHLRSKAVPEDCLLDPKDEGTTLAWNVRNYSSNDTASYPRIIESSATLSWQPRISQHCHDNPVSHNTAVTTLYLTTLVTTLYLTTLLWQPCISQHCCDNPVSHNTGVTTLYLTTLLWQPCISQHWCDNPVSHNTVVTTLYLTTLVTNLYLTTLLWQPCISRLFHLYQLSCLWHNTTLQKHTLCWPAAFVPVCSRFNLMVNMTFTKIIHLHDSTAAVCNFYITLMPEVNMW